MGERLLIFDCDGVLVDSERIAIDVFLDNIRAAGGEIDDVDAYAKFLGRSRAAVYRALRDDFDIEFSETELERMQARLFGRLRRDLQPMPGIAEVLPGLSHRCCVASSSEPDRIHLELEVTGLLDFFEARIYSASMVREGKPSPDLFLHAAKANGVPPSDCIVIEDSPSGIRAAQAAGMRVLAFTGGSHAALFDLEKQAAALGPDAMFADMRQLPDLLEAFEVR